MSQEKKAEAPQEQKAKKRPSLWWLNLLLALLVFIGGVFCGLVLSRNAEFNALAERYYPSSELSARADIAAEGVAVAESPAPTATPTPSAKPTPKPSATPGAQPTVEPSVSPSAEPTVEPSVSPSAEPTVEPSPEPSEEPAAEPTEEPEPSASPAPSEEPSVIPAAALTEEPEQSAPAFIGVDEALTAALRCAGTSRNEATVYGVYKTREDDLILYRVELAFKGNEYVYLVNAQSAQVEGWWMLRTPQAASPAPSAVPSPTPAAASASPAPELLGLEAARARALESVGVSAEQTRSSSARLKRQDGAYCYEVRFTVEDLSYTVVLDAYTGDVISCETVG